MNAVIVEDRGSARIIRLNREQVRNALNAELVEQLMQALSDAEASSDVRGVVLTGAGPDFCAGADLKVLREIAERTIEENREDSRHLAQLFRRIHTSPKPVIAAVNGNALAGGCGLACVCDFVIAGTQSKFGFTESRIGFVAAIVSMFLMDRVGPAVTRDLLLTGRRLDAQEAASIGLANTLVADEQVIDTALAKVEELAKCAGSSLALTKRLLAELRGRDLDSAIDYACDLNAETRATADCKEGIAAFLEKRKPSWIAAQK